MTTDCFNGQFLRLEDIGKHRLELVLDNRQEGVNTLSEAFIDELQRAVAALQSQPPAGLLISSAKPGFLAGANIDALAALLRSPAEAQVEFCQSAARVLCALEDLPCPSVTLINGFALGGGLEFALSSDYRVADSKAALGFPEVGLGVLPGVGGTVKSARLVGVATALEWLSTGRSYPAGNLGDCPMVDQVCEASALRPQGLALLDRAMTGELDWQARRQQRHGPVHVDDAALSAAKAQAAARAQHYPAALEIIELVERCAELDRDAALIEEAQSFARLASSSTARALVAVFQAQQSLKKKNKGVARAENITRAGVLGAGIMGGGIAFTTAQRGTPVIMKDIADAAIELGMSEARKLLKKPVAAGKLSAEQAEGILDSIQGQTDYREFDSLDIVAEAVVEKLAVKQAVLAEVEQQTRADTVLASNTSSLCIADIAKGLARPENLTGMHFFNPVHMMPLVEVVKGPQSSDSAVARTIAYALQMGKTPLLVKDCPGFLINRILGAYFSAFNLLVRDGVAFARIDQIMTAWGWPMGPAYLLDVAGLDTLDKAMVVLGEAYPEVMTCPGESAISRLAREGRYGQKSGAGFYQYQKDDKGRPQRKDDPDSIALLAEIQAPVARDISDQEIEQRMLLAMVLEASRCLSEGICDSASDIDTGMRLGTGFPAHFCGPLWYADFLGAGQLLSLCEHYADLGGLYRADADLIAMAARQESFYRT